MFRLKRHYISKNFSIFSAISKGFTLIELAIVMILVGAVMAILVRLIPTLTTSSDTKECKELLERVDQAIKGYCINNFGLPWADTTNPPDGLGDAPSIIGNLPWRDLGLSSGNDPWGWPIRYGVHRGLVDVPILLPPTPPLPIPNTTLQNLRDDFAGLTFTPPPALPANSVFIQTGGNDIACAYILVSGGNRDLNISGGGWFNYNFDGQNEFAGGWPPPNNVANRQFHDPNIRYAIDTPPGSGYDDIMKVCTLSELLGLLSELP